MVSLRDNLYSLALYGSYCCPPQFRVVIGIYCSSMGNKSAYIFEKVLIKFSYGLIYPEAEFINHITR